MSSPFFSRIVVAKKEALVHIGYLLVHNFDMEDIIYMYYYLIRILSPHSHAFRCKQYILAQKIFAYVPQRMLSYLQNV